MRIVVTGASAAGGSLCETARWLDPSAEITLISQEGLPLYSRCLLPRYVNGEKTKRELQFRRPDWAETLNLHVIVEKAVHIHALEKQVELASGERVSYDRLAVATGASAIRPGIPGIEVEGVFHLYTLASAEALKAWVPGVKHAVVLGAGLIGMKVAAALTQMHKQVALVEQKATVMPDTLDPKAAEMMSRLFASRGVQVRTCETLASVLADKEGHIKGVRLASGQTLDCEMLVCAVGTKPNAELVSQAGGKTEVGAVVNAQLETSLPGVFAVGDAAEAPMLYTDRMLRTANWFNAKREGRIAAYNMLGERTMYQGRLRANAVELLGLPLVSVGQVNPEAGEAEVLQDPSSSIYRKLVFQGGRLVGFILLGEVAEAGALTALVQTDRTVTPVRGRLLRQGAGCLPDLSVKTWAYQSATNIQHAAPQGGAMN